MSAATRASAASAPVLGRGREARRRPALLRGLLLASCAVVAAGAAQLGAPADAVETDPELARLLRAMAVLKAAMVVAALGLLTWRLAWPVAPGVAVAYLAGAATCVAASVAIAQLAHLAAAAVAFHAGGAALLIAAFLDRPARAALGGGRGEPARPR